MNPEDYNPDFSRNSTGQFNIDNNYMSIKAGSEGAIIEDEMNEMQWIQIEQRAQEVRSLMNSGFILNDVFVSKDDETDFNKNGCFYIKNLNLDGTLKSYLLLNIQNYLPINMNGYVFRLGGQSKYTPDNVTRNNHNILINIPDYAPTIANTKNSVLILECYIKEVQYGDKVNYLGGISNTDNPSTHSYDNRLNLPTTNRTQLVWQFRFLSDTDTFNEGIYHPFNNNTLNAYYKATNNINNDKSFNRDINLYVSTNNNNVVNGNIFAIPVLQITQTKGSYTINYNNIVNDNTTSTINANVSIPDTGINIGGNDNDPIYIKVDDNGNASIVDNNGVYKTLIVNELDINDNAGKNIKLKNNGTGLTVTNPDNSVVNINDLKTSVDNNTTDITTINNNITTITNTTKVYTTTNSGNIYSVSIDGITTLNDGYELCLKFNANSTGNISIKINNITAKNVLDYYGENVTDVTTNLVATFRYNATTGNFILQGKGGVKAEDKQALIDLTNEAVVGNSDIRNAIVNALNNKFKINLSLNTWNDLINNITELNIGNATVDDVLLNKTFTSDSGTNLTGTATIQSLGGYAPGDEIDSDNIDVLNREGQTNLLYSISYSVDWFHILTIDDNNYGLSAYNGSNLQSLILLNNNNIINTFQDDIHSISLSVQLYTGINLAINWRNPNTASSLFIGSNAVFNSIQNIYPSKIFLSQNKKNALIYTLCKNSDGTSSGYSIYDEDLHVIIDAAILQDGKEVFNHTPGLLLGIDNNKNIYYKDNNNYTLYKSNGITQEIISQYNNLSKNILILEVDNKNNIYIIYDSSISVINKYDNNLNLIWSTTLNAPNSYPTSCVIDLNNTLYINYNNIIYKIYSDGTFSNIVVPYSILEFKLSLSEKYLFISCRDDSKNNYIYKITNKSLYKLKLKDK